MSNKVLCFRMSNLKILFRKNPNPEPVLSGVPGVLPGAGVLPGILPGAEVLPGILPEVLLTILPGVLQGILHFQRKKNLRYHEVLIEV